MAVGKLSYQLPAILALLLAIALTIATEYTFKKLAQVLNFSILGIHPLGNVAHAIESVIVEGCREAIATMESWALSLFHDALAGLEFLFAILALLGAALVWVARYTYDQTLANVKGLFTDVAHPLAAEALIKAKSALAQVNALERTVSAKIASAGSALYQTITREYGQEITRAGIETWKGIDEVQRNLRQEFEDALKGIEGTAGSVAGTLDAATEATIRAIEEAQQSTTDELNTLLRGLNPADIAGLLASIPVVTALVQAIATEAGLNNAECRAKVRGICGTNPQAWEALLVGLLPLALTFSLRDLADFARPLVRGFAATIREVA